MAIYGTGATPLINMLIDILSNEYSANVNVMDDAHMTLQLPENYNT